MKWANETTKEVQSFPPWPAGTVVCEEVLTAYPDWIQVADDYELPPDPAQIAAETQRALEAAVDAFMDGKAREKGFRDRHSFALRAGIPGSSWHAQALVFGAWMDAVNDYCWQVRLDCLSGNREVPTIETLLAELPALEPEV